MSIHGYVKKRLTLQERFKLWLLNKKSKIYTKRMDRHLVKAFKANLNACKYEEFLKISDEKHSDFIKSLNTKYA